MKGTKVDKAINLATSHNICCSLLQGLQSQPKHVCLLVMSDNSHGMASVLDTFSCQHYVLSLLHILASPSQWYSEKFACPVDLACSRASFSPLTPILQVPQRRVKLAVSVNWRALFACIREPTTSGCSAVHYATECSVRNSNTAAVNTNLTQVRCV